MWLGLANPSSAAVANVTADVEDNAIDVIKPIERKGYHVRVNVAHTSDPVLFITKKDSNDLFSVYLTDCVVRIVDVRACGALRFSGKFVKSAKSSAELMNIWNRKYRYTRAYATDGGTVYLDMDLNLAKGGISRELFDENLDIWIADFDKFKKFIEGPS